MAKKQSKIKSIEETLWESANKLRGSVEPSEYKHVVLSLIFLKYMYSNIDFSNLTEQDIKNLIIVSLAVVIEMEEKLKLTDRFSKILEKSAEIADELEKINQNINNNDISTRLLSLIKEIKEMAEY